MKPTSPALEPDDVTSDAYSSARADRRSEPRYVPVMETAYLGWWEGETLRAELGVLWIISAGGAALDVDVQLEAGETVWVCVIDLVPVRWFAARLLGRDGRVLRLQFAEPFPFELLERVVWGTSARAVAAEPCSGSRG